MSGNSKHPHPEVPEHEHHLAQRISWGWWVFAILALFYLLAEHRAHLFGALPFLLLLACPVMHMFMHHGSHHRHGTSETRDSEESGK